MTKLINDSRNVVPEMLEGLVQLHPDLELLPQAMTVLRAGGSDEVAIISGGGAGHEPAHAGYVGPGLLRAAVSGDVFTSPSTDAVLEAIRAVADSAGVLLVVKNYTGDRLNFGLAAELARADGVKVEMVVVDDDLALASGPDTAGRRGIAGTVLIHKVAGAAAAAGLDLAAVAAEARDAIAALGTVGVGLSACTVPGAEAPGFTLEGDSIELGLGIHGERGVRRMAMPGAAALCAEMLDIICKGLQLGNGDRIALLVNGLGATPLSELLIMTREALRVLGDRGVVVERCWTGSFLTALDMQGCSLSLLRLTPQRLERLDAAARAPAWPGPGSCPRAPVTRERQDAGGMRATRPAGRDAPRMRAVLLAVVSALREAEPELTRMDQAVGDGDLGLSLSRGASAILEALPTYDLQNASATLEALAGTLRRALGGTSGPLYAVFLLQGAKVLRDRGDPPALRDWADAFEAAWRAISDLGDARPGDRTMLDALAPAAAALSKAAAQDASAAEALSQAAKAAGAGAHATIGMVPRRGRSSYLADRVGTHPDPGAVAVQIWLKAIQVGCAPDGKAAASDAVSTS